MADYQEKTRSNYFSVTDEKRLKEIIQDFDNVRLAENTEGKFAIIGTSDVGIIPKYSDDMNAPKYNCFDDCYPELQEIISENDAIILSKIGWESMRYCVAETYIILHNDIKYINPQTIAVKYVRDYLDNIGWTTQMDY